LYLSYNQALNKSGLDRLDSRHDAITQKMFQEIKDQKYPLHYLLPPVEVSNSQMVLRPTYPYQSPLSKSFVEITLNTWQFIIVTKRSYPHGI